MVEMARFIKPILSMAPPGPGRLRPREWLPVARLARAFNDLSREQRAVFIQLMTMSAADFLDQWFETDPLKATISASGIIGTFQGIRSPGTAYVLLHHYMGEIDGVLRAWGIPRGGTGAVSEAIASAARSFGAEIRTETPVEHFLTRGDEVTGAVTSSGEEVIGRVTLSSLDPQQTFVRLLQPGLLDGSFLEDVERYRYRGSSGKVNLALDGLPEFTCLPGEGEHLRGAISFSPSIDYMELAYDDAKAGRFSRRPFIDMVIPTLVDPSMAPPGKHVMSCFVQYAPYHLADGAEWDDARREAFGETVLDTIEERAPNIRELILHAQVLTPKDIEDRFGLSEGNIFQGELSLEQLFFNRPVPAGPAIARRCETSGCAARPRTPEEGSWGRLVVSPPSRSCARSEPEGGLSRGPRAIRRGRGRCRPQRPGGGGVPGEGGSAHARSRAPKPGGRPTGDRGGRARRARAGCRRRPGRSSCDVVRDLRLGARAFEPSSRTWWPSPRPSTGLPSRCGATRLAPRRSCGRGGRVTPRRSSRSTAGSALWPVPGPRPGDRASGSRVSVPRGRLQGPHARERPAAPGQAADPRDAASPADVRRGSRERGGRRRSAAWRARGAGHSLLRHGPAIGRDGAQLPVGLGLWWRSGGADSLRAGRAGQSDRGAPRCRTNQRRDGAMRCRRLGHPHQARLRGRRRPRERR